MKKILFTLVVMLAFILTTNAQNYAMVDNSNVTNKLNTIDKSYASDNVSYDVKALKDLLVEELKVYPLWKYEDAHYSRIKIIKVSPDKDTYSFTWTYQAPSKKKPGYDYIRMYIFKKYKRNPTIGDSSPASDIGIKYIKR